MTENPKTKLTPGEEARRIMNELLKQHTVCGELILKDTISKNEFLQFKNMECAREVNRPDVKDPLESIYEAIEALAAKKAGSHNSARFEEEQRRLYRAANEVLGFIKPEDWTSGQSMLADFVTYSERRWEALQHKLSKNTPPETKESAPDHGLTCVSYKEGIAERTFSTIDSCKKDSSPKR